jgi:hypothetical protein
VSKIELNLKKLVGFKIAASDKAQAVLSSAKIGVKSDITSAETKPSRKGA